MKKSVYYLLLTLLISVISCKNTDSAVEKIDDKTEAIPPADPTATVAPVINDGTQPAQITPDQSAQKINQQAQQLQVQPNANVKLAGMKFNKKVHDFGTINQGDKVNYTFTFVNTGKNDLIISNAVGSCGCTVPEYPKEPVKPGKSGKMKVSFDSSGKSGQQSKTVSITANTPAGTEKLEIKASINSPVPTTTVQPEVKPIEQKQTEKN